MTVTYRDQEPQWDQHRSTANMLNYLNFAPPPRFFSCMCPIKPKFVGWHGMARPTHTDRSRRVGSGSNLFDSAASFGRASQRCRIDRPVHKNVQMTSKIISIHFYHFFKNDSMIQHHTTSMYMLICYLITAQAVPISVHFYIGQLSSPRKLFEEAALDTFVGVRAFSAAGSCTSTGTCRPTDVDVWSDGGNSKQPKFNQNNQSSWKKISKSPANPTGRTLWLYIDCIWLWYTQLLRFHLNTSHGMAFWTSFSSTSSTSEAISSPGLVQTETLVSEL